VVVDGVMKMRCHREVCNHIHHVHGHRDETDEHMHLPKFGRKTHLESVKVD
jgi:hypothetical protein